MWTYTIILFTVIQYQRLLHHSCTWLLHSFYLEKVLMLEIPILVVNLYLKWCEDVPTLLTFSFWSVVCLLIFCSLLICLKFSCKVMTKVDICTCLHMSCALMDQRNNKMQLRVLQKSSWREYLRFCTFLLFLVWLIHIFIDNL